MQLANCISCTKCAEINLNKRQPSYRNFANEGGLSGLKACQMELEMKMEFEFQLKAELHAEDKRSEHGINKRKNASKAKWEEKR